VSSRNWKDRIRDILEAISEIETFVSGMDYDIFSEDDKTIRAVEMNFIIIGEAASSIPDEIESKNPKIPWNLMRGMRNRIVHAYFTVDPQLMWETIHKDFPAVVPLLRNLLEE